MAQSRESIKQVNHVHYFEIVKDHFKKFIRQNNRLAEIKKKLDEIDSSNSNFQQFEKVINQSAEVRNERDANGHIVIVFSAMFLEAIIFDFGLQKFSKSYLNNHLDKLSPKSKWVIIPKLVTGNELKSSSQTYQLIQDLFSLRNDLVHNKPRFVEIDAENFFKETKEDEDYLDKDFISSVKSSLQAVKKCIEFLYKISPTWEYKKFYNLDKDKNKIFEKCA